MAFVRGIQSNTQCWTLLKTYRQTWISDCYLVEYSLILKKPSTLLITTCCFDKLNDYGFRGIINDWFSSYLKNRTQTMQVGHHISDKVVAGCSPRINSWTIAFLAIFLKLINYSCTDDPISWHQLSQVHVFWYPMNMPIKTHSISSKTDQDTDQETWILISLNTKYSI